MNVYFGDNFHRALRSVAVAMGIFITVYVSIPDYPYGTPLWQVLVWDANGWLHEVFYIWVFVLSILAIDAWFEWTQTLRQALNAYLGFNGAPPVLEKVKRIRVCRRVRKPGHP